MNLRLIFVNYEKQNLIKEKVFVIKVNMFVVKKVRKNKD